ncbi:MAG: hypothetical protein F4Y74_08605 [Gemmatimonadales bacterium]|nr:hypothetical protein [Gemmatimonadales bacterium]MYG18236.1 hypothetical protein [Gemmatimonadales bacterium]
MRTTPAEWTIVAVGDWNPRVFLPEWVRPNLFADRITEDPTFEYVFQPTGPRAFRIQLNDIIIAPQSGRLVVGVHTVRDDLLEEAERVMRTSLELLSHTPLQALGVNLQFEEPAPPGALSRLFALPDLGALSHRGVTVSQTTILRQLQFDNQIVNFKQIFGDDTTILNFNFHYPVSSTLEAANILDGTRLAEHKSFVLDFLAGMYDLTLSEDSSQ